MNQVTLTENDIKIIARSTDRNDHTGAVAELLDILFCYDVIGAKDLQMMSGLLDNVERDHYARGWITMTEIDTRVLIRNNLISKCANADEVRGAF